MGQPSAYYWELTARTTADYWGESRQSSSLAVEDGEELAEGVYSVECLVHSRKQKVHVYVLHRFDSSFFHRRHPVSCVVGGLQEGRSLDEADVTAAATVNISTKAGVSIQWTGLLDS